MDACIKTTRINSAASTIEDGSKTPITPSQYFARWKTLTVIDFLLIIFAGCALVGLGLGMSSAGLSKYARDFVSLGFLGVVSFITINMMNQKVAADVCSTCNGLSPMNFTRKIDVIMSFVWANMQTFVALLLNVFYFFITLFIIYILLRSHLLYRYGDSNKEGEEYVDLRIFSRLHVAAKKHVKGSFPINVFCIIYWIIMIVSILSVFAIIVVVTVISIQSAINGQPSKEAGKALSIISKAGPLTLPFVASAVTLNLRSIGTWTSTMWLNNLIAKSIVPLFKGHTVAHSFNFLNSKLLKKHVTVFVISLVLATMFATVFLEPLDVAAACTNGEVKVGDPKIEDFKQKFVFGHYFIGIAVVMLYVVTMGGKFGTWMILGALMTLAVMYFFLYLVADAGQKDDADGGANGL